MKKRIFCAGLFVCLAVFSIQAQEFGVRGGYQRSTIANDGDQVGDPLGSFYLGVFRNQVLGAEFLKLHTGLDYFTAGYKNDSDNLHKMSYLAVNAALRAYLGPVFIQGGLSTNFKLSEKYREDGDDDLDDDDKVKFLNVPIHGGLGVQFSRITLEARYYYSLWDINDTGDRLAYLQVGAGLSF